MRALDSEVVDVIWRTVEPLIPVRVETHPLGCHRQRKSDRACFAVIVVSLATGKGPLARVSSVRPLTVLGEASYSLYVLSAPLAMLVGKAVEILVPTLEWIKLPLLVVTAVCASLLAYRFIELPARGKLRALLSGARSQ